MNSNEDWNYSTILVCCDTKITKNLNLLIPNAHLCHVDCYSYKHYVNINLGIRWVEMFWFSNRLDPRIFNTHLRLNCSGFLFVTVSSERIGNQSYTVHFSISRKMCQKSKVIYEMTAIGWEEQPFLCINYNFWHPSEKKNQHTFLLYTSFYINRMYSTHLKKLWELSEVMH